MLVNLPTFDPAAWTLEYKLACPESANVDWSHPDGELAFVEPTPTNSALGHVWKGTVDATPGPCSVTFLLRDSTGEVICSEFEEFVAAADAPTEVDVFMGCESF
jgi:hypothetical protein